MGSSSKLVAVTGVTGYVASELVKQLLAKGYRVRGTVRSLSNPAKYGFLKSFPNAEHLELHEADLTILGTFDKVFNGVECVFHTASPYKMDVEDPQRDLVDPALNGTLNVLSSIEKSKSVKTVVLTSSTAAVYALGCCDNDKIFTEDDWNTTATISNGPYYYSKVVAEKAAWDWAKRHPNIRVVSMNPSWVLGPVNSNRPEGESVELITGYLNGQPKAAGQLPATVGVVDVRDVAKGHIAAFENPNARGRFVLCAKDGITQAELIDILRSSQKEYAQYPLPAAANLNGKKQVLPKFSSKKAQEELGIKFIDLQTTVLDMARSVIQAGLVNNKKSKL